MLLAGTPVMESAGTLLALPVNCEYTEMYAVVSPAGINTGSDEINVAETPLVRLEFEVKLVPAGMAVEVFDGGIVTRSLAVEAVPSRRIAPRKGPSQSIKIDWGN